jgi:hypothetical protein
LAGKVLKAAATANIEAAVDHSGHSASVTDITPQMLDSTALAARRTNRAAGKEYPFPGAVPAKTHWVAKHIVGKDKKTTWKLGASELKDEGLLKIKPAAAEENTCKMTADEVAAIDEDKLKGLLRLKLPGK